MKYLLLTSALMLINLLNAQLKTVEINSKKYLVYPYQEKVVYQKRIFKMGIKMEEKIQRDSLNREIISTSFDTIPEEDLMEWSSRYKKYVQKNIKVLRKEYPAYYCEDDINLLSDITPSLQALPDGDYIQYYRDFPYIDENNVLRYRNDIPCAYFSLKDNKLDGHGKWFMPNGRLFKEGDFKEGFKEGKWSMFTYNVQEYKGKKVNITDEMSDKNVDTSVYIQYFKEGMKHGVSEKYLFNGKLDEKGFYTENEPSGEWFEYAMNFDMERKMSKKERKAYLGKHVLIKHYTYAEKSPVVHSPIFRSELGYHSNDLLRNMSDLYKMYEPEKEEEGLELPEEKFMSYPGEDDSENRYINDGFEYGEGGRMAYSRGKFISRSKLIDSLGYEAKYTGVYEEFYSNGKPYFKIDIQNGIITEPDTLFTAFGTPESVLYFKKDSSQYVLQKFDFMGDVMNETFYDTKGEFIRTNKKEVRNITMIKGLAYESRYNSPTFGYYKWDTLEKPLTNGTFLLTSTLLQYDTSTVISITYDAANRELLNVCYNLNKDTMYKWNMQFSEDFESLTGSQSFSFGDWSSKEIYSAALQEYYKRLYAADDTVLNARVKRYNEIFDFDNDFTLMFKGVPYSGKFELEQTRGKFKIKGGTSTIQINSNYGNESDRFNRKLDRFAKKGKGIRNKKMLTYLMEESPESYVLPRLFDNISTHFDKPRRNFFRIQDPSEKNPRKMKTVGEKKANSFDKFVEGEYKDGKPVGVWRTFDQYGKLKMETYYENGQLEKEIVQYKVTYPDYSLKFDQQTASERMFEDSLPEKPIYHLDYKIEVKNGLRNGKYLEYDWMGNIKKSATYLNGFKNGDAFETNKLIHTEGGYEYGQRKGKHTTYLTLPNRDSLLLFDLNFADGMLQGESKTYHMNGKLAKHGYFLSGQPIEDYEAFDTLGFKYQYVRFQYNQPVEEKIWEENELSVKYTFDWRDSVEFKASDLTSISSLESILYKLGLQRSNYANNYYGRPSVLEKSGIDYHMTKFYPNDTMARDGDIEKGKKVGCWMFWDQKGKKLYEVEYFDSIIQINDSVRFKSKGLLTFLDAQGKVLSKNLIVEKMEKYDCSHTDHHEVRMLYCIWEKDSTQHRRNGYVKNYYDNGVLMNEGKVKDGLATGVWKFYDPYGNLNIVGEYVLGKRNGRWLKGDLSSVKYMGDICLNPNLPNLDEIMSYQEKLLDISIINYKMSKEKSKQYYGIDMNTKENPGGEDDYEEEYMYDDEYEIRSDIQLR